MKVLLYEANLARNEFNEPLAIETLAGYLMMKIPAVTIELKTYAFDGDICNLKLNDYDVVGISLPYNSLDILTRMGDYISKNKNVIVGGALPTFAYESILHQYPKLICSIGEGEYSLYDYVLFKAGKIKLGDVRNIAYAKDNVIVNNAFEQFYDFTKPYRPNRFIKIIKSNSGTFRIEGSRGCSYSNCSFCYTKKKYQKDSNFQRRTEVPIDLIISQIVQLSNYGVLNPFFVDDDFIGGNFSRIRELALRVIELKRVQRINNDMMFYVDFRVTDVVSQDFKYIAPLLIEAGFNQVFIGLETGCNSQLKRYKKGVSAVQNAEALNILKQFGFDIEVGFMFFDIYVTLLELKECLKFIQINKIYDLKCYMFDCLRVTVGTAYYDNCDKTLLKDFTVNTLSYKYDFLDTAVQRIWDIYSGWKRLSINKYYETQMATRGEYNDYAMRQKLKRLNYLDFLIMQYIVEFVDTGNPNFEVMYLDFMEEYYLI